MDLFLFDDQTQIFFGLNEIKKISSVMPFSFNAVELNVMTINERPWTCAREVRRALQYNKKPPIS